MVQYSQSELELLLQKNIRLFCETNLVYKQIYYEAIVKFKIDSEDEYSCFLIEKLDAGTSSCSSNNKTLTRAACHSSTIPPSLPLKSSEAKTNPPKKLSRNQKSKQLTSNEPTRPEIKNVSVVEGTGKNADAPQEDELGGDNGNDTIEMPQEPDSRLVCVYCDETYVNAEDLSEHQKSHDPERPYHCTKCDGKFRFLNGFKLHKRKGCMRYIKDDPNSMEQQIKQILHDRWKTWRRNTEDIKYYLQHRRRPNGRKGIARTCKPYRLVGPPGNQSLVRINTKDSNAPGIPVISELKECQSVFWIAHTSGEDETGDRKHLGVNKTLELVGKRAFWPNWSGDIRNWVLSCEHCREPKKEVDPSVTLSTRIDDEPSDLDAAPPMDIKKEESEVDDSAFIGPARNECQFCGLTIINADSLPAHEKKHLMIRAFKCSLCGRGFVSAQGRKNHQNRGCSQEGSKNPAPGPRLHSCSFCGLTFRKKFRMSLHIKSKHLMERPYLCATCGKSYSTKASLKSHSLIHTDDKKYKCSQCDASFYSSCNLKAHQIVHTDERPHVCWQCGKSYRQREGLNVHMRQHGDVERLKCSYCDETFTHSSSRHKHEMMHQGDRQFACAQCPKKFWTPHCLKTHLKTHMGIRKYSCHLCDMRFTQSSSLKRHIERHERKEPGHSCHICGKTYTRAHQVNIHMKEHLTDSPYRCHVCGVTFKSMASTKAHVLTAHPDQVDPSPNEQGLVTAVNVLSSNFQGQEDEITTHSQILADAEMTKQEHEEEVTIANVDVTYQSIDANMFNFDV